MGCIVSKKNTDVVPVLRRRLSLGEIGEDDDDCGAEVTESDRSLLLELSQQQVLDYIQTEGRRFSLGTQTDKTLHEVQSFGAKTTQLVGETSFDASKERVGFACKKGLKPEAPNQDSFLILKIEGKYNLYGVFDGHGRKGHDVSNFVKDNLPKILFSQGCFPDDPMEALRLTFEKTQYLIEKATFIKTIDATRSGTTCSVVLHCLKDDVLYCAHVGDSRVVLGKKVTTAAGEQWQAVDLTRDHKPDLPEERQRIEQNGGVVVFDGGWNYRVFAKGKKDSRGKRYPGLNMSRAMGDLTGFHDAGISASPDVNKSFIAVQPTTPVADGESGAQKEAVETSHSASISSLQIHNESDKFILLCSDGVWEFIASQDAVLEVAKFSQTDAGLAAENLASLAWEHWMTEMDGQVVDDITAVVIHL